MLAQFSENIEYFREFLNNAKEVSAVLPTSAHAGNALAAEVARCRAPKRVLEVGAGTGAITHCIAPHISSTDHLTVCELNHTFMQTLRQRFEREQTLHNILPNTDFVEGSIVDFQPTERYDFIVSALPFNSLPPALVDTILQHYQQMLKPGGILSYIEYIGGRTLKQITNIDPEQHVRLAVLKRHVPTSTIRRDVVLRNVPPAWVHHLRFTEAPTKLALSLQPGAQTHRMALPTVAVDSDAVPFVGGALTAALVMRIALSNSRIWLLPITLAGMLVAFFRDPWRETVMDPTAIYAASDGVVLSVEEIVDERFGNNPWLRVAVFLSLIDVHVNRAPVAGKVIELVHEDGGFANASHGAAEHNQTLYTVIESMNGPCIVAQRVGLIARRIVNRCPPGTLVAQGDKMGLIRFGSRTDVYIPAIGAKAMVQEGTRVVGGVTILARYTLDHHG